MGGVALTKACTLPALDVSLVGLKLPVFSGWQPETQLRSLFLCFRVVCYNFGGAFPSAEFCTASRAVVSACCCLGAQKVAEMYSASGTLSPSDPTIRARERKK